MDKVLRYLVFNLSLFVLINKSVLSDKVNENEEKKLKYASSDDDKDVNKNIDEDETMKNNEVGGGVDLANLVNMLFAGLVVVVIILKYVSSKASKACAEGKESKNGVDKNGIDDPDNKKLKIQYRNLRLTYFTAYFAAIFGDWLQGPYVYRLYSEYGFKENQIAILFLTGFGSSFTFGTFTGPLADKFGRKSMTQVFCFLYSLSCVIKFSSNFWILICGRICAGIATSLLFRY